MLKQMLTLPEGKALGALSSVAVADIPHLVVLHKPLYVRLLCAGGSAGANMYAQAQAATRRAASGSYSSYDGGDSTSSGSYDGEDFNNSSSDGGDFSGTKEGARIAKLAAKAARAARMWKSWQSMQQRSRRAGLLLTATSVSSSGESE
jgi:hypothetical protein